MNEKTVTVVIPTYNAERTLGKTIEACLNQDYPKEKLEVIVVDDGSTDNTAQIVKRYPVRYIFQEKGGPAKARNTGWKNAKGEIICFTDADCIPPKDWVEKFYNDFVKKNCDILFGKVKTYPDKGFFYKCVGAIYENIYNEGAELNVIRYGRHGGE